MVEIFGCLPEFEKIGAEVLRWNKSSKISFFLIHSFVIILQTERTGNRVVINTMICEDSNKLTVAPPYQFSFNYFL